MYRPPRDPEKLRQGLHDVRNSSLYAVVSLCKGAPRQRPARQNTVFTRFASTEYEYARLARLLVRFSADAVRDACIVAAALPGRQESRVRYLLWFRDNSGCLCGPVQFSFRSPNGPVEIEGFGFGKHALPKEGEGKKQLDELCKLDAQTIAGIVIYEISGHTDKVPVRRNKNYADNVALSLKRIESVEQELRNAGFKPEWTLVPAGESAAGVARNASNQDRAADRKVVIKWRQEPAT